MSENFMSFQPPNPTSLTFIHKQEPPPYQPHTFSSASVVPVGKASVSLKTSKRTCSAAGCNNGIVQGGLCVSHGAKRRICQFPGCTKHSKAAGLCSKHGPPRKKCNYEGCKNVAVRGGKCKTHGASSKKCFIDGCIKVAAVNGMCKRHHFKSDHTFNSDFRDGESSFQISSQGMTLHQNSFASHMLAAASSQSPHLLNQNKLATNNQICSVIGTHNRTSGIEINPHDSQYPPTLNASICGAHQNSEDLSTKGPNMSYFSSNAPSSYGINTNFLSPHSYRLPVKERSNPAAPIMNEILPQSNRVDQSSDFGPGVLPQTDRGYNSNEQSWAF